MTVRVTIGIAEEDVPKLIKAYEDGTLADLGVTDVTFPTETPIKPRWSDAETTKRCESRNSKNKASER